MRLDLARRVPARLMLVAALCLFGAAALGYWCGGQAARGEHAPASFRDVVARTQGAVVGVRCVLHPSVGHATREGSGFLVHGDGLIVTSAHLVASRMLVLVEVADRGRFTAEVVGEDEMTDLAVLRLVGPFERPFPTLAFGDSDKVSAGDWVLTLGCPMTLGHTVTAGLVSSRGRHLPLDDAGITASYLQFSAAVNPGSSGSPVLDTGGRVVGVATGKSKDGEGLAFAVPSRLVEWVLARMAQYEGRVPRGYLGLSLAPGRAVVQDGGAGARVTRVERGGPAWLAGIRPQDIVVRFDGKPVDRAETLYDMITQALPATEVAVEVRSVDAAASRQLVAVLGTAGRSATAPKAGAGATDPPERAGASY